ncbi:hypothetical protein PR202_ga14039 [Eleusine coracana subsp. coracana]|uniref:X8 domain-containing protein n=1 Tax=Eleusine coracana subsp. coracana TaxID=191504 RepID=A0AAV5CG94_ELECO|nr:hypothetical protein PR202_ga14039 [Eleusine coracana subsp. coracana]
MLLQEYLTKYTFTNQIVGDSILLSGAFVDVSYDSTTTQVLVLSSSSVITDYRVLVTEKQRAYIFLKPLECRTRPCRSEHLAGSLFVSDVVANNQHLNVSNVVVTATERQLGALRRTLQSVHASLADAGLASRVSVSPELSLSSLRIMAKNHRTSKRKWDKVMELVRRSGSFVQVEMEAEANDDALGAMREAVALSGEDAGVVLHVKTRAAAPSAAAAEIMARLVCEISGEEKRRILGLLVDALSPRRELAESATRRGTTVHDDVTNPVTVPATNPASPGIVTVPSTNPGNPGFASSSNLPPLYPEPTTTTTTPVTMPPDPTTTMPSPVPNMNPVAAPTMPGSVSPVTNPATTPSTTITNPANTFPDPQQGGGGMPNTSPVYQPPATMPGGGGGGGGTVQQPAGPSVGGAGGQTWCVAKTGLTDLVLQNGIDYACGMGGADCSAIQPMGSCYNPNTVQAHASYAFNSYFQRNPSPASCDFGGAGTLVNVNPSSGTCMYQTSGGGFSAGSSSGVTGTVPTGGYNPGPGATGTGPTGTTMGGGTGSTVLNANNPGGNSMYGGYYDSPSSLTAGSASLSCRWVFLCLIWIITFAFVKEKV